MPSPLREGNRHEKSTPIIGESEMRGGKERLPMDMWLGNELLFQSPLLLIEKSGGGEAGADTCKRRLPSPLPAFQALSEGGGAHSWGVTCEITTRKECLLYLLFMGEGRFHLFLKVLKCAL